jgi:hypothetical protein
VTVTGLVDGSSKAASSSLAPMQTIGACRHWRSRQLVRAWCRRFFRSRIGGCVAWFPVSGIEALERDSAWCCSHAFTTISPAGAGR